MAPFQTNPDTISQDMVTRVGSAAGLVARIQQDYAMQVEAEPGEEAREALATRARAAAEQVIDLSGDGPDLRSLRPVAEARDAAVAAGIRINALAVAAAGQVTRFGEPLAETYRREVIGGPGAFVVSAEDRRDIGRALRAKLVREIA